MSLLWNPPVELTEGEQFVVKHCKSRRLFVYLRIHRHEIFDEPMQAKLLAAYGERRRGEAPVAPARLAMAGLLQAAFNVPDREVPILLMMDRRWQMVMDCLDAPVPPLSQGTVHRFRQRMIEHGLDKVLFERTVELARKTGAFGATHLRAAFDACPLYGCGRVEDTFNLIGRAAFHVVRTAAERLNKSVDEVASEAGIPVVLASSIKAGLDVDWDDANARSVGLRTLLSQVDSLSTWLTRELGAELENPPISHELATLNALVEQDTDPDPSGGRRMKEGVAKERVISLGDKDMRHGRKSKRQRIDGYKRHIAVDLDAPSFIVAVAVTAANRPEREAAKDLLEEIEARGARISELQIDRGYLGDDAIEQRRLHQGMEVISKPFPLHNRGLFTKADFTLDLQTEKVTCPNDVVVPLRIGAVLHFPDASCDACPKRAKCTRTKQGSGRSLSIHHNEPFLIQLRQARKSPEGRSRARDRVHVEHGLARLANRTGVRARYKGLRKNLLDQRRHAAIVNLTALAAA